MKKLTLPIISAVLLSLSLLIPSFAMAKNVNLLFLQTAQDAKIIPQKNDTFLIKLDGTDKYVSYFSDRPNRITGLVKATEFADFWKNKKRDAFEVTPPNAAIESAKIVNGKEKRVEIFASLSKPHYDVSANTMSYVLTPLNKNKTQLAKMDLGYTVIFFDDLMVHWGPNN